jgi:hypothetical protein
MNPDVSIKHVVKAPGNVCFCREYSPNSIKKLIHSGESTHLQYITGLLICFQTYSKNDNGKLEIKKRKVSFDILVLSSVS